jgi:hypothetical protein
LQSGAHTQSCWRKTACMQSEWGHRGLELLLSGCYSCVVIFVVHILGWLHQVQQVSIKCFSSNAAHVRGVRDHRGAGRTCELLSQNGL